ncbi:MAG: hypothetical protein AB2404_04405 [Planifilum fimeticola]|jgi:hypothetical protein
MYMVIILVLMSILAVIGTLHNKRTGNRFGFFVGGLFTLALIGVTGLALYDAFVGLQ